MVIPRMVSQALRNEPITIYGTGQQSRCFCHVGDVIDAVMKLSKDMKAIGNIYNIGSTEEIKIQDLAAKIKKLTKSKSELVYVSYDKAYEKGFEDIMRRVPSTERINKLIGFKPKMSLEQTIQDIIDYQKSRMASE
jgi:UDP-glucose 4-epimerase